jgi:hypothetical protein
MPHEYWILSPIAPRDMREAILWNDKALGQLHYYQATLILNLPEMLKGMSGHYACQDACFDRARSLLRVFHKLRDPQNFEFYEYKANDFIGFFTCITIVLGTLGYGRIATASRYRAEDWALINKTMQLFKEASHLPFSRVTGQAYRALHQLLQSQDDDQGPEQNRIIKIAIPFFGTIFVKKGQMDQTPSSSQNSSISQQHGDLPTKTLNSHPTSGGESIDCSMDTRITYDGLYMQSQAVGEFSGCEGIYSSFIQPTHNWQTLTNIDIDQDWSCLINQTQADMNFGQ